MKPEAIPETVSTIAQLGPWGLVVLVVIVLLAAIWLVASKLAGVFAAQTKALEGIALQFVEHKLHDERLHAATRAHASKEADEVRQHVAGLVIGLAEDLDRAEQSVKAHVSTEIQLARAGAASPFHPAVRPARGSRPGG